MSRLTFNRGAIRPMECLREGWQLIKDDYWLFMGISFVGALLASVASVFLMGPAMCGIYLCFLRRARGKRVSIDMLFKGFDYYVQSLIAALCVFVPFIVLVIVCYGFYLVGTFTLLAGQGQRGGGPPDAATLWILLALTGLFYFVIICMALLMQAFLLFTFQLIVDRELPGFDAVRLNARAVLGNSGGVIGLLFLMTALSFIGALACCVGAYLVMPISYAMITVAYLQVFPPQEYLEDEEDQEPLEPEPPEAKPVQTGFKDTDAVKPT